MQYTIQDFIISCLMGKTIYTEMKQDGFTRLLCMRRMQFYITKCKKKIFSHFMGKLAESTSLWKSEYFLRLQNLRECRNVSRNGCMHVGFMAHTYVLECTHTHTHTHQSLWCIYLLIKGRMNPKQVTLLKIFYLFIYFLSFVLFQDYTHGTCMLPGQGSNQSYSCQPTPQPQQCQVQAMSATYTTAHGNAGSPTHYARPEIEPATSWFLVRFVSTEP